MVDIFKHIGTEYVQEPAVYARYSGILCGETWNGLYSQYPFNIP
jgi:hypothetical protein